MPHLRRLTIYGTRREGMFKHIAESDLVITTYALLRRDLEEMEKYEFNTVILDEAQNIKNPNTITARAVRRINARMRLCLSGTPIENNPLRALEPVRIPHAGLPRFAACLPARHRQAHQGRRRRDAGISAHPRAPLHPAPHQGRSGQGPAAQGGERHLLRAGRGAGRALRRPCPQAAGAGAGRRGRKGPGQEPDVHPGRPAQAAADLLPSAPAQARHAPASPTICPPASSTPSRTWCRRSWKAATRCWSSRSSCRCCTSSGSGWNSRNCPSATSTARARTASSRWTGSTTARTSPSSSSPSRPAARAST